MASATSQVRTLCTVKQLRWVPHQGTLLHETWAVTTVIGLGLPINPISLSPTSSSRHNCRFGTPSASPVCGTDGMIKSTSSQKKFKRPAHITCIKPHPPSPQHTLPNHHLPSTSTPHNELESRRQTQKNPGPATTHRQPRRCHPEKGNYKGPRLNQCSI